MKGRGIGMVKLRERISVKDVGLLLIGAVIYSIGTHAFMVPANIAPGGASGIALMVNYLTDLPVGALTLVLNIPLLILAWFYLSRRFAVTTAAASIVCSLILDLAVAPICPVYNGDRMLCSLYGGVLVGVGMAMIFMTGDDHGWDGYNRLPAPEEEASYVHWKSLAGGGQRDINVFNICIRQY